MTDIPKLTTLEATYLRLCHLSRAQPVGRDTPQLAEDGLLGEQYRNNKPRALTDLGRAALAAYDAEQRRQIRAEAIAECLDWVRAHASCEGIAEKIARDIEENVKP